MYFQIPVPAPIAAPFTPQNLQAWADAQRAIYERLRKDCSLDTFNEDRYTAHSYSQVAEACAAWMREQGLDEAMAVGPFVGCALPAKGERVRIRAGAVVNSTSSKVPPAGEVIERARVVTIHDVDPGYADTEAFFAGSPRDTIVRHARVNWVGSRGFWFWTDLINVEAVAPA